MLTTFGRYIIKKKIGKGGMGEVYLAFDPSLNRKIALKVITSTDQEALERFRLEAQTVAQLKHPNIVQVYETDEVGKQHYMTMDYIDGTSLERIIGLKYGSLVTNHATIHKTSTETKMDPLVKVLDTKSIARIIMQVALALEYTHSKKLVHRDIKPANILIDKQGAVFLTDFGIAKQMSGLKKTLTITGTTIGTPEYMSPEQAMGKKDALDPRSDIFSLGATLYRAITGKLPFEDQEVYDVFTKVIHREPVLPSKIIKKIPKDLETICLKCLDKDRYKRYQTAKELAEDLQRFIEGEPVMARRTGYVTKLWRKARKNKTAAIGIASALAALIGATAWRITDALMAKETVKVYWQEAQELHKEGKYDDARAICEKILEIDPYNIETDELKENCIARIKQQQKQVKAIVDKSHSREKAKVILDRARGAANADDKIRIANEALKADPAYGDAYQTMGYAYTDKAKREKDPNPYRKLIDKAHESFSKAIEISPHLAYSYYERAIITAYIYDKPKEAMPDFEMVFKYDPESHIGYFARGNIEANQGKYNEALASYSQAIKIYPKFAAAYNNRGLIYKNRGELDKALDDYNQSLDLDPSYAATYNNRGIIYLLKGNYDLALSDFNEALRISPRLAEVYFNRAIIYEDTNEPVKAIADLEMMLQLQPGKSEALFKLGLNRVKLGQVESAVENFTAALSLDPDNKSTRFNRGLAYAKKGDLNSAISDFAEYIRTNPGDINGYLARSDTYIKTNQLDKALADLDKAAGIAPKDARVYCNRGAAYGQKGNLDAAFQDFNTAISLDKNDNCAYLGRGILYVTKAERERNSNIYRELIDKSIADYSQTIKLKPSDVRAYACRAIAYSTRNEFDRVIADCSQAIKIDPKFPDPYFHRSRAHADKSNFSGAIADGEAYLKLVPPDSLEARDIKIAISQWKKKLGK